MNPSGFPACLEGPCIQSASIKKQGLGAGGLGLGKGTDLFPRPQPPIPSPTVSGAVAQLGERLICIQEVAGSIPVVLARG